MLLLAVRSPKPVDRSRRTYPQALIRIVAENVPGSAEGRRLAPGGERATRAARIRQIGQYASMVRARKIGRRNQIAGLLVVVPVALGWGAIATPASGSATDMASVGQTRRVGPLAIKLVSAVGTPDPHTYRLALSVVNKTGRSVHIPHVDLHCKGGLGPQGFGLTGFLVSDQSRIAAHAKEHGELILYPQQVCEEPSVRFYTRQKRPGGVMRTEEVAYSLQGLL